MHQTFFVYEMLPLLFCFYLIVLFNCNSFTGKAQTNNSCGGVARIWPSAHDSVVPVNTIISFTSVSTNATSVKWLYDGQFTGLSGDLCASAGIVDQTPRVFAEHIKPKKFDQVTPRKNDHIK